MSTAARPSPATHPAADAADPAAAAERKDDAAEVLRMVLGEGVVAALHEGFAKGGDFTGVVPLLVAAGARPHLACSARAALAAACDGGRAGAAALLLAADGVRPEDADAESTHIDADGYDGLTLLGAAVYRGDAGVVRALVASGKVDVNAAGRGRGTALRVAAEQGHADCLSALLAADGVKVNVIHWDDRTALMDAACMGHIGCVRAFLADARADVNHHTDKDGWTALDLAAANDETETVRALVAHGGVDLGHTNNKGQTALHHACRKNNAETVLRLLVAGSCRFALDNAAPGIRRTPLALAEAGKAGDAVRAAFLSGVDYWQRHRHAAHSRAMREVMRAVMLARQHLDAAPQTAVAVRSTRPRRRCTAVAASTLVHLPEESWLLMCSFLRSADFQQP